jgi:hypothetical protein
MLTRDGQDAGKRSQAQTIGFVLVIGFVVLGSVLVAAFGAMAISDTQNQLSAESAETALTQFDSKAALVALGESDAHDVSFGSGGVGSNDISVEPENGWMNVTITNRTTEQVVGYDNITLGALVYEGNNERLAYQGGGVWSVDRNGGQMVSAPEFHYRGSTLTLPAVSVEGDRTLNERMTIERNFTRQVFPNASNPELTNPLDNHVVNVTVGSEFYRAWGEYFSERTDGEVELDDSEETARLTLVTPIGEVTVEGALAGQESSGKLLVQGNPHHPCSNSGSHPPYIDTFDSSEGAYCDQYDPDEVSDSDELVFGGDVETAASAGEIQADLVSGGQMTLAGQMDYYGNLSYTDGCTVDTGPAKNCEDAQADGYITDQIGGIEPSDSIRSVVERTVQQASTEYPVVTLTDGTTLTAGDYYIGSGIELDDDNVTLDTGGGDITVAVEGAMELENGANITVVGDGEANIYVNGTTTGEDMEIEGSTVFSPQNNATRLTVLGGENFVGKIVDSAAFSGTVYAPAGEDGTGEVVVDRKGTVYGAIVTGDMILGQPSGGVGASVHFDTQLTDEQVVPPTKNIIPVTYLHITENQISVSD